MMLSMLKRQAPTVPITVAMMPTVLPLSFFERLSQETPALKASRKVVVTVESIMMSSADTPSPALSIIWAMSLPPV